MQVEWTAPAEDDLAAIDNYLFAHSETVAEAMIKRIHAGGDFLGQLPHAGQPIDDLAVRKWSIRGTNHLLLYRVLGNRVQILRVRHAAEDWQGEP